MIEYLPLALTRTWPVLAFLSLGCWLAIAASLWRLKSIKALDLDRNNMRGVTLENGVHAIVKLFIITLGLAALTRLALAPDYPGGAFAIDLAFLSGGFILLLFSLPGGALIALMSRGMSANGKRATHFMLAVVVFASILFSGAGQLFAAAAFVAQNPTTIVRPSILFPMFFIGTFLTAGVWAHFQLLRTIIETGKPPAGPIMADATLAVAPTFLAALLTAAALYPVLLTS